MNLKSLITILESKLGKNIQKNIYLNVHFYKLDRLSCVLHKHDKELGLKNYLNKCMHGFYFNKPVQVEELTE